MQTLILFYKINDILPLMTQTFPYWIGMNGSGLEQEAFYQATHPCGTYKDGLKHAL